MKLQRSILLMAVLFPRALQAQTTCQDELTDRLRMGSFALPVAPETLSVRTHGVVAKAGECTFVAFKGYPTDTTVVISLKTDSLNVRVQLFDPADGKTHAGAYTQPINDLLYRRIRLDVPANRVLLVGLAPDDATDANSATNGLLTVQAVPSDALADHDIAITKFDGTHTRDWRLLASAGDTVSMAQLVLPHQPKSAVFQLGRYDEAGAFHPFAVSPSEIDWLIGDAQAGELVARVSLEDTTESGSVIFQLKSASTQYPPARRRAASTASNAASTSQSDLATYLVAGFLMRLQPARGNATYPNAVAFKAVELSDEDAEKPVIEGYMAIRCETNQKTWNWKSHWRDGRVVAYGDNDESVAKPANILIDTRSLKRFACEGAVPDTRVDWAIDDLQKMANRYVSLALVGAHEDNLLEDEQVQQIGFCRAALGSLAEDETLPAPTRQKARGYWYSFGPLFMHAIVQEGDEVMNDFLEDQGDSPLDPDKTIYNCSRHLFEIERQL